jgi:hypothetical protein
MRSKAKLIVPIGLVVAIAAAGLSLASGGGGSSSGSSDSAGSFTPIANGAAGNSRNKRGPRFHREFLDEDVHAVLEDIRAAVAKQAPEIAGPIIDKAEGDGKITKAQADKLRQAAEDVAAGKRPDPRALGRDEDVEEVIHDAFAAAGKKAPAIGEPIIGKALDEKKITETQADQIRDMLKRGPAGPDFERHGPGFGPPPIGDKDVVAVLDDVRAAVAKQAPAITGPIIDKAESDGKITTTQADKLRETTKSLTAGKPPKGRFDLDLRDADVREVVHDAFEAVAKQTPKIAKPIIDKAVGDKKITQKQADQITDMLSHKIEFGVHHGHGPGPGPGHGRGHRPPPGLFPPGGPPPPDQAPGSSVPGTPSAPSSPA